jgi:hypothetical protein
MPSSHEGEMWGWDSREAQKFLRKNSASGEKEIYLLQIEFCIK